MVLETSGLCFNFSILHMGSESCLFRTQEDLTLKTAQHDLSYSCSGVRRLYFGADPRTVPICLLSFPGR